jgi:multidrug efflux pump subunit AcrB
VKIADYAIDHRTTTLVLTAVLLFGGISSFQGLARLEDPEFTIKEALVITPYPGATAAQVEEEVSDKIETAVQQLGQLKEVESKSDRGLSTVTVRIKDKYTKLALPQVWDELRRKVGDVQGQLPPGAGPSIVNDDYADVWGVFVAITGPEFSYAELKEVAKFLRKELLLVQDVAKIDFWGTRTEAVYVEPGRERMSQLGIRPNTISDQLRGKNIVSDSGRVTVGTDFVAIDPTGTVKEASELENILLTGVRSGSQTYLKDIADIRRGYVEPQKNVLRYDGNTGIGLGISTVSGGNVVVMGDAIAERARELLPQIDLGIEFGIISLQSDAVTTAIDGFLVSLYEAVAIVVAVLLLFMGLRSGLIIGFILAITISGTFIFMGPWDVALERISLGALIIALGMLVDNAIVVVDGILVRTQGGQDATEAAREVVGQTAIPLLGATAVAIMAFGAIGLSEDSTGEFCQSLFQVVLISLGLSWVTAVTVTPVICIMLLKPKEKKAGEEQADAYGGALYRGYRAFLALCVRFRGVTVAVVLALFGVSLYAFQYVDTSFFPNSTRPQYLMDFWLPQGTHIDETRRQAAVAEEYLQSLDSTTHVTTLVGAGGMRFLLTYTPEKQNPAYAQFLIDLDDYSQIDTLIPEVERGLMERHPDSLVYGRKFVLGPGSGGKIQARISGTDLDELRRLAGETMAILHADGGAKSIRTDWRGRVRIDRPILAEDEANAAGITRPDVALAMKIAFEGERTGVYRDHDELLPIIMRAPQEEREDIASQNAVQIWSPAATRFVPLRQVVSQFETVFEDESIWRLNRKRTITVHADAISGPASKVFNRIRGKVEALEYPPGYELEWWGEYRDSAKGAAGIAASLPFFLLAIVLIVIMLFDSLRQPLVIFLTVPLALIGVTLGLLSTGQPFGFMATLGFLSLSGMLIKNAIVLIDEIENQKRQGNDVYTAIMNSGVSRLRPVAMAALTTALGMIPLLVDAFFVSMAVTIIFGLVIATVLTMIVVPVLYAIFFRAKESDAG